MSRRLAEEEIIKHITTTDADIGRSQALSLLRNWYLKTPNPKPSLTSTSNRSAAQLLLNPEQHIVSSSFFLAAHTGERRPPAAQFH